MMVCFIRGVGHMEKKHSARGNPLPPLYGLLFSIRSGQRVSLSRAQGTREYEQSDRNR